MRLSMIGSSPTNVIAPPVSAGSRPTLFISSLKCSLMLNVSLFGTTVAIFCSFTVQYGRTS